MNYDNLIKQCKYLKPFYDKYGTPDITEKNEKFSGLIKTITGQLLSTNAARTIYNRVMEKVGGENYDDWLKISFDDLRACGLNKAKIDTLTTVATDIKNNTLDFEWLVKQDSQTIYDILIKYKGIGDWTAKGYPLMQLQKEDFFLNEDLGVRDGVQVVMNLDERPSSEYCQKVYEKNWQPYGGSASRLMWFYKDSQKNKN
ncbi:MAG: DNA-3-methyladenine glycosylase family protein [Alphaproteobacteria bacterium]